MTEAPQSEQEQRSTDRRQPTQDRRQNDRRNENMRRGPMTVAFAIMWVAITGYFIGLTSPMTASVDPDDASPLIAAQESDDEKIANGVDGRFTIPASSYAEIADRATSVNDSWTTRLAMLKEAPYDPLIETPRSEAEMLESLLTRQNLRAFAGAPPTVPHTIDQRSSRACLACHGQGIKTKSLRAAKMSHQFLENCTQCHVEQTSPNAAVSQSVLFRDNSFVGKQEQALGERASKNAPPVIPHSTWMRSDCLSCHGHAANPGMRTTHAWRQNCTQCHAGTPSLDQIEIQFHKARFLPPLEIEIQIQSSKQQNTPNE